MRRMNKLNLFLGLFLSISAHADMVHMQAKVNANQFTYDKINVFLSDEFEPGKNPNTQVHVFATEWSHDTGKQIATSEAMAPMQASILRGNTKIKDIFLKYQPSQSDVKAFNGFTFKSKDLHNVERMICKLEDGVTLTGSCNFFIEHKRSSVYVMLYFSEIK